MGVLFYSKPGCEGDVKVNYENVPKRVEEKYYFPPGIFLKNHFSEKKKKKKKKKNFNV